MDNGIVLNNEEYLIVKEIMLNNRHFIYAVATDSNKYTVLEQTETPEGAKVKSLTDENEIRTVLNEIAKENN